MHKYETPVKEGSLSRYAHRLADRLIELLQQEKADKAMMQQLARMMEENGLLLGSPSLDSHHQFAADVIRDNDLVKDLSVPMLLEKRWNPQNADHPESLVAQLLIP